MDKLLSIEEAAVKLGRTPLALRKLVERHLVPFRKDRRRVLFLEQELEQYIAGLPGLPLGEMLEREEAGVRRA